MSSLSYTSYVDRPTHEVQTRLRDADLGSAHLEITPFVDRTRIVVRHPWDDRDPASRRTSTLAATRVAMRVNELAAA